MFIQGPIMEKKGGEKNKNQDLHVQCIKKIVNTYIEQ